MIRIIFVIALMASLYFVVRHWQPAPEPATEKVAVNRAAVPAGESNGEAPSGFNPAVPDSLPDIEKGYIFSEKRKIEKEAPPATEVKPAVVEPGPEVLDSVAYTGSLIVGNTRRALVTYQEAPKEEAPGNNRPVFRRAGMPPPTPQAGAQKNKQLIPGDILLGFVVGKVEPDRIVFEKGEQKVEKMLYDRNKQRLAAATRSEPSPAPAAGGIPPGVPPEAFAPPEARAAAKPPDNPLRAMPGASMPPIPGNGGMDPAAAQQALQANRMVRRSQRLVGADSAMKMPAVPVPGRPVPINQPAPQ